MDNKENVFIANINLGEFKEINFETARFSDGSNSIRGFGYVLNDRNLSIIDTFEITFAVDYKELQNFLFIYHSFKAFGALPITNKYIMEKIKSSVVKRTLVSEFNSSDTISSDKLFKDVTALIVLLETISVRSIEQSDKGFMVSMVLTLHKECFDNGENNQFNLLFKQFTSEQFGKIVSENVSACITAMKTNGGLKISIANNERINILNSYDTILLNSTLQLEKIKGSYIDTVDNKKTKELNEALVKQQTRMENAKLPGQGTYEVIDIPSINIGQIELITHNDIASIPIVGNNIGIKSFMGLGQTTCTVKMIFDENDNDILAKLKMLSDKNILNHKYDFESPLITMFDMHSGNITHIHFDNAEQIDGIVVTMKINLNGIHYFSQKLKDTFVNNIVTPYDIQSTDNEKYYYNYLETLTQNMFQNFKVQNDCALSSVLEMCATPIDGILFQKEFFGEGSNASNTVQNSSGSYFTLCDALSAYSTVGSVPGYHDTNSNKNNKQTGNMMDVTFNKISIDDKCLFLKGEVSGKNFPDYSKLFIKDAKTCSETDVRDFVNRLGNKQSYDDTTLFLNRDFISMTSVSTLKLFDGFGHLCSYLPENQDYVKYISKNINAKIMESYVKKSVKPALQELINAKLNVNSSYFTEEEIEIIKKVYEFYFIGLFDLIVAPSVTSVIEKLSDSHISSVAIDMKKYKELTEELNNVIFDKFYTTLSNEKTVNGITKYMMDSYRDEKDIESDLTKTEEYYFNLTVKVVTKMKTELKQNISAQKKIAETTFYIGLSKTIYAYLIEMNINRSTKTELRDGYYLSVDKNHILRMLSANLISSCFMSVFLLPMNYNTCPLGTVFRATSRICGNMFASYANGKFINELFLATKNKASYNEFEKEDANSSNELREQVTKDTLYWLYGVFNSYNTNDIDFAESSLHKSEIEPISNIVDFLYFFGEKIKDINQTRYIEKILASSNATSYQINNNFISGLKSDFTKESELTEVEDLWFDKIVDDRITSNTVNFPITVFGNIFKKVVNKLEYYNERFKKRLLGNFDVFDTVEKIVKVVDEQEQFIVPNYRIMVLRSLNFKDESYRQNENGKIVLLSGINSVRISKDPKTKIHSASIELISPEKYVINQVDGKFQVGLFNTDGGVGDLKFVSFSVSDDIYIDLGYQQNLKRCFNGCIKSVTASGNFISIVASGFSSELSAETISINGGTYFNEKTNNGAFHIIKEAVKSTFGQNKDKVNFSANTIDSTANTVTNSHLFTFPNGEVRDDEEFMVFDKKGEESSMFNMSALALNKTSYDGKKYLFMSDLHSKFNGELINDKKLKTDLQKTFGTFFSGGQDQNRSSQARLYENIYNVDRDYEVYGVYK